MTQITRNFTIAEFAHSDTARRLNLGNWPPVQAQDAIRLLCLAVLQPLRDAVGPVTITSGFRSPAVNAAVNGSRNSQHMRGEAADFTTANMREAFDWIRANTKFDQLIWELGNDTQPDWIHVSHSPTRNRGQVLRKEAGKPLYAI